MEKCVNPVIHFLLKSGNVREFESQKVRESQGTLLKQIWGESWFCNWRIQQKYKNVDMSRTKHHCWFEQTRVVYVICNDICVRKIIYYRSCNQSDNNRDIYLFTFTKSEADLNYYCKKLNIWIFIWVRKQDLLDVILYHGQ